MESITNFGARGDGKTVCTPAIQRAIDACGAAGGGTVVVPPGQFVTGTLWLRSNVTLHLDAGATLVGVRDVSAFPVWAAAFEGRANPSHAALITGENLENIAITGRGTIDGSGQFWWDLFRAEKLAHFRPRVIRPIDCRNVLIDGVTLIDSPAWTVNPVACDNVTVTRLTIKNPHDSPNTDGINPDACSNVRVSDCHIDVGDDCVTIKSGTEDDGRPRKRPCENVAVTNCTMLRGHGGVVIGSEMSGGVRNVVISNCVMVGTDRGIRLKSRRGRGGVIEDVRASNIVMDGVLCPIVVNLFYGCGAWGERRVEDRAPHEVTDATPRMRRLRYSNITARNAKYAAAFILGLPEMYVEDVALSDVSIYLDPSNTKGGAPAMAPGVDGYCRAGIHIQHARHVRLRNVDVFDQVGPPVVVTDSDDVRVGGRRLSFKRMSGVPLSEPTRVRLEVLFRGEDREVAKAMLVTECGSNLPFCERATAPQLERLRFAALKLSGGNLERLREAVGLAKIDWRDLLMAAGFGNNVRAHERWMPAAPPD